jgi:hypothetical protein
MTHIKVEMLEEEENEERDGSNAEGTEAGVVV